MRRGGALSAGLDLRGKLVDRRGGWPYYGRMKKVAAIFMIVFVLSILTFGTWQLFLGNLEAAFSSFPFLLIAYVFMARMRK